MFDPAPYEEDIIKSYRNKTDAVHWVPLFRKLIYDYYDKYKRDFPWRQTGDSYAVFVSEVMLQQTQTARVVPKFERFMEIFPDFSTLASAPVPLLLQTWQGLGYNRRALNLQKAAVEVVSRFGGFLPSDEKQLLSLPGVGKYTSASVRAFAFNLPSLVIDTNIRAVFIHLFFKETDSVSDDELLPLLEKTLDRENCRRWYSALMDFGAFLKSHILNPGRKSKHYTKQSKFEGSLRQIRGRVIKYLCTEDKISRPVLYKKINIPEKERLDSVIERLIAEKFIICDKNVFSLYNKNET